MFRLWVSGCSHVGTGLRYGRESLAEAIRQSEGGGAEGGPAFEWDVALHLGDFSGSQEPPGDEEGAEAVRQLGALRRHRREDVYTLVGNHDASGPLVGRGPRGGYPAGAVTGETLAWWRAAVEANPDCVILSAPPTCSRRRRSPPIPGRGTAGTGRATGRATTTATSPMAARRGRPTSTTWTAGRTPRPSSATSRITPGPSRSGWAGTPTADALTRRVGDLDFGPAPELDHEALLLRWFDHWLKDRDTGMLDGPPARYFLMGRNEWREADAWPPPGTREARWYLASAGRANTAAGDGRLVPRPPDAPDAPDPAGAPGAESDVYRYDPRDPVPTVWPLEDHDLPLDQRPLDGREDLLVYVTAPLERELAFAGDPVVELYAASSALDTDFVARLCDVHPDGLLQPLAYGIVRARFRDGLDRSRVLTPGAVERYRIPLHPVAPPSCPGTACAWR